MSAHWQYFKYVAKHKYFVWVAGLKAGVSIWRLLIHDWTKYLPCEWTPYVNYFYGPKEPVFNYSDPSVRPNHEANMHDWKQAKEAAFDAAWNHHQKHNKHHFQYYILNKDDGGIKTLQMPHKYAREMVADWFGAGRAITGRWEGLDWYWRNTEKIQLHPDTREYIIGILCKVQNDLTWHT